jgi:tetratricopeptide (TPR) repeat protein
VPPVPLGHADPAVREAVEAARREVREQPRYAAAWGHLAMLLHVHEFPKQAAVCYAEAEKLQPNEPRWCYYHGQLVLPTDPEAGLRLLRRAVQLWGTEANEPRLRLAETLLAQGRTEEARGHFEQLARQDPDNPRVHLGLGQLASLRGNWQQSLHHLRLAVASPFARKSASVLLVAVYRRLGQDAEAANLLRQAYHGLEDRPWPDPWSEQLTSLGVGRQRRLERATQLLEMGRYEELIRLLREVARDYPDGQSYTFLGQGLLQAGRPAEAERALRTAITRGARTTDAYFFLGLALYGQAEQKKRPSAPAAESAGELREAINCFRQVIRLNPTHALAHYSLGLCYKSQQKPAQALAAFRMAAQCQPELGNAHYELARALLDQGRDAAALAEAQQALVLRVPTDPRPGELLAVLLARSCLWH